MKNAIETQFIHLGDSYLRDVLSDDRIGRLIVGTVVDVECNDAGYTVSLNDGQDTVQGILFNSIDGLEDASKKLTEGVGGTGALYVYGFYENRIAELTIQNPPTEIYRFPEPLTATAAD